MIELDPVVSRLPARYKFLFFLYTLPGAIYALVGLILCSINPFWFRQQALRGLERHVNIFGKWRNKRMQKHYDKYSVFNTIKTGKGV
jgi:hypothetical protein